MSVISPHRRYLSHMARHKWFVFLSGLRYSVPIHQLIVHDWSKLLPREWGPWVDQFYRDGAPKLRQDYYQNPDIDNVRFNTAWLRHCHGNKHHWHHYAMVGEGAFNVVIPMPERFAREMVADWSGAGRAYGFGSDPLPWYTSNRDKMTLHPETRQYIERILGYQEASA